MWGISIYGIYCMIILNTHIWHILELAHFPIWIYLTTMSHHIYIYDNIYRTIWGNICDDISLTQGHICSYIDFLKNSVNNKFTNKLTNSTSDIVNWDRLRSINLCLFIISTMWLQPVCVNKASVQVQRCTSLMPGNSFGSQSSPKVNSISKTQVFIV